jgi:hypothetical protein
MHMKKILFTFLLLFNILNVYSQQNDPPTLSLQDLVNKYENLENTRGSILNYFSIEEITQLRNYYAVQNSMNLQLGGFDYTNDGIDIDPITRAVGNEGMYGLLYKFDINTPALLNLIGPGHFQDLAGALKPENRNEAYTVRDDGSFYSLDVATTTYTYLGNINPSDYIIAIAFNPVDGKLYGISETILYLIDPVTLTTDYVGFLGTAGNKASGLAITSEGNAYTYDLNEDKLYSIDLTTGVGAAIGYIGFNAAFHQSMAWDPQTNTVYMAALNGDNITSELRSVNLETGMTTNLGQIGTSILEFYWIDFYTEEQSLYASCDLTGETTNGPTFNRANEDGSALDVDGENVFFHLYGYFHVSASGTYTITSTQDGWDGMIFLYENNFSRNNPLINFVAGNDNFGGVGTSQITMQLEAGTLYYLVTTGVNAGEYGNFETQISGAGNIYCNDGNPQFGCDWTVSVSGHTYGHFITWKLSAGEELILSGGHYTTNGFSDMKFATSPGPLTFEITSDVTALGGSAEFVISNGDQIVASGQIVPGQEKVITNLNCTVLVDGCLDAPLGQFPTNPFTPSCGDGAETITTTARTGEYTLVNLTQGTQYIFTSSVETDYITIANEAGTFAYTAGTGLVSLTPLTTGAYRFYLHLNDDCDYSETGNRSKYIECVSPVGPPANDECENAIPVSCGDVVTGSIYFATNSGGTSSRDVFYKYTGNGQPEVVTLSLCNSEFDSYLSVYSDCSLSNLIMYNDNYCGTASQLTFYSDGISTYYILVEGSSDVWLGSYELEVTCETDEDNYDPCALEQKGRIVTGLGLSDDQWGISNSTANDFNVLADTQYILEKIIIEVYSTNGEPTTFDVTFHEGETGVGAQFGETIQNLTPTSIQEIGVHSNLNYSVYKVELTLPNPVIFPATVTTDKKYWIALKAAPTVNNGDLNWASIIKFSPHTLPSWRTQDGGVTWVEYQYGDILRLDGIMSLEGECATLGMDDLAAVDFAYYPNPTKNLVNIQTSKAIESIEIFNMAGQKLINTKKLTQKQIDLSSLPHGTYMVRVRLEGNQIETFKILRK